MAGFLDLLTFSQRLWEVFLEQLAFRSFYGLRDLNLRIVKEQCYPFRISKTKSGSATEGDIGRTLFARGNFFLHTNATQESFQ